MLKRLIAITFIFVSAGVAWLVLGGTLVSRTSDSDTQHRAKLTAQWGSDQTQQAPAVCARVRVEHHYESRPVPISSSRIAVALELEQRRDGLLWYNLYSVRFAGHYRIRNTTSSSRLSVHFPFPASDGTYADFSATIAGHRIADATALDQGSVSFDLPPGAETSFDVAYRSRGMGTWAYRFGSGVESVNDFALQMRTNF